MSLEMAGIHADPEDAEPHENVAPGGLPLHPERRILTAQELGISLPLSTVKPMLTALGLVVMFGGLLFLRLDTLTVAFTLLLGGAGMMIFFLYNWLLSPLEAQ